MAVVLHEPATDVMHLHMVAALHSPTITRIDLPVAESPAGIAWQTQQPLLIPDIDRETRFSTILGALRAEGMRSV